MPVFLRALGVSHVLRAVSGGVWNAQRAAPGESFTRILYRA